MESMTDDAHVKAQYASTDRLQTRAELLAEAGSTPPASEFTPETAGEVLGRLFRIVTRRDIETRATFPDHAAAAACLATVDTALAEALPHFDGPAATRGTPRS